MHTYCITVVNFYRLEIEVAPCDVEEPCVEKSCDVEVPDDVSMTMVGRSSQFIRC